MTTPPPPPYDDIRARLVSIPNIRRVPTKLATVFRLPGFLTAQDCAAFLPRIEAALRPSTIADDQGIANYRTSATGDLNHHDPVVSNLNTRLHDLLGIAPAYGEPLQGQCYQVGQEFRDHTDYFEPGGLGYHQHCAISGNRTWTAMIYLNEPLAGGATRFRKINQMFQPATGSLLIWANLNADGTPNADTLHHGMKVRKGTKYVITKWFRERPWPWDVDP